MRKAGFPGCCKLNIVYEMDCLAYNDEFSKREVGKLDKWLAREKKSDEPNSFLVVLSNEWGEEILKDQQVALKAKGFKFLGSFPGMGMPSDTCYLYGSKGFRKRL